MMGIVNYFLLVICVLISVAFLTLFERSGLGYIQIRKGPNKVGPLGILQPFADAIKLCTKEGVFPTLSNYIPYLLCPVFSLFFSLGIWCAYPDVFGWFDMSFSCLLILALISISVYPIMGSGWFSNSKYALLGSLRSVAQTISYEVCLALVLIMALFLIMDYSMGSLMFWQEQFMLLSLLLPVSFIWIVIMLAETNRTPFDFAESESELVSGFNIEYGGGGLALIFMAEYSSILFMSMIYSVLFFGGSFLFLGFKIAIVSFMFIWIRGMLPRFRYDKLMYLAWKSLFPIVLNYFVFIFGLALFLL